MSVLALWSVASLLVVFIPRGHGMGILGQFIIPDGWAVFLGTPTTWIPRAEVIGLAVGIIVCLSSPIPRASRWRFLLYSAGAVVMGWLGVVGALRLADPEHRGFVWLTAMPLLVPAALGTIAAVSLWVLHFTRRGGRP